jgi:enamine deaminase RidA (YjgF/YER057c/UK114 family)
MKYRKINPEEMGAPRGWNHGMLAPRGRVLFVAGQTAADASGKVQPADFVTQFGLALDNILRVLRDAGCGPEHVGRMTVYVTSVQEYRDSLKPLGAAWRERMGRNFPAMALMEVSGLVDPDAVVEIETTAVVPDSSALNDGHDLPLLA